jgi:Protein of unknown function (DUF2752)
LISDEKKKGLAQRVLALAFLAPWPVIFLVTNATRQQVWFLGNEIHLGCWFRDYFGVPCPVCGMTRSVILTVHGDILAAMQMHIGGPLLVAGMIATGVCLILAPQFQKMESIGRKVIVVSIWYFSLATAISFVYSLIRMTGHFLYL